MNSALIFLILLSSLVAMVLVGQRLQRHLPDHHLNANSKDAVKLGMGLVATMTALLLGLLVSSAKGTYDTRRAEVIEIAAKVTLLDHMLTAYGPDAAEARALFREAITEGVRRVWSDVASARAPLAAFTQGDYRVYTAILGLSSGNDLQRDLKVRAATVAADIDHLYMLLLAQSGASILDPLLIAVSFWLVVLFLSFGLLAPTNATATLSLIMAAVSVASAIFLTMELDHPLIGMINLSGEPLFNALNLFTQ